MQSEMLRAYDPQLLIHRFHPWREATRRHANVVIARVDQQANPQAPFRVSIGCFQAIANVDRVSTRLQPDALLNRPIAQGITPYRHPPM